MSRSIKGRLDTHAFVLACRQQLMYDCATRQQAFKKKDFKFICHMRKHCQKTKLAKANSHSQRRIAGLAPHTVFSDSHHSATAFRSSIATSPRQLPGSDLLVTLITPVPKTLCCNRLERKLDMKHGHG